MGHGTAAQSRWGPHSTSLCPSHCACRPAPPAGTLQPHLAAACDDVAHCEPRGVLVDLDRGCVGLQPDDLSNQFLAAHPHQLVHGGATHAAGYHHRARHLADVAAHGTRKRGWSARRRASGGEGRSRDETLGGPLAPQASARASCWSNPPILALWRLYVPPHGSCGLI